MHPGGGGGEGGRLPGGGDNLRGFSFGRAQIGGGGVGIWYSSEMEGKAHKNPSTRNHTGTTFGGKHEGKLVQGPFLLFPGGLCLAEAMAWWVLDGDCHVLCTHFGTSHP